MFSRSRLYMAVVICLQLLFSPVSSAAAGNLPPKHVVVTGKAAGAGLMAQDEARADARRNAVAQACGVFVDAYSAVKNYELIRDRIIEHGRGYITGYEIKREWAEGGISYCEIRATVDAVRLKDTWEREFAQLREEETNPRTVLILTQDHDTTDLIPAHLGGACQTRLEAFLRKHDVLLLDHGTLDAVRDRDIALASASDDVVTMAARAAEFSADLLLYGKAEATPLGAVRLGGNTIYRHSLTLSMRVIQADSAQILTSNAYPAYTYKTSGAACGDAAFAKLADKVAEEFLKDVNEAWKKRATSKRIFRIVLQDCSRREFRHELLPEMLKMRGVQQGSEGVKLREAVSGQVMVDVYWAFDLNALADKVELITTEHLAVEIIEQSANRIVAKVIHKG